MLDRPARTLITLVGQIAYKRRVYKDGCGCRRYLLDEILGIGAYQRIESSAFLWIVRKSAAVSYGKTGKAFCDRSGVGIARTTVMRCVHKEGELLARAEARQIKERSISVPVLFAEFDGFWVNIQVPTKGEKLPGRTCKEQFKKKSTEMKAWVAYAGEKGGKRVRPIHWASNRDPLGFFKECIEQAGSAYEIEDAEYLATGSDAAGWCKNHEMEELVPETTTSISRPDTSHVNQRLYKAFSEEEDRSECLGYLYGRDFEGFFKAVGKRLEDEPDDERYKARCGLRGYIANNLDRLDGMTPSKHIREGLLADLPAVFGDRPFYSHLHDLLGRRRYKRFLATLEETVQTCDERLCYDYENYLVDAKGAIARITPYRTVRLGSVEGTDAEVYAARLKVWGCAWSERGAIAMMRIRATPASGRDLIAPAYGSWLSEQEKKKIEASRHFNYEVAHTCGEGYGPPRGSLPLTTHMAPKLFGALDFSRDLLPARYPSP